MEKNTNNKKETADAFEALEQGVHAALETYSNVHRGSGHYSLVSTYLFEHARIIILEYLGLDKSKYTVIFCSPHSATALEAQLEPGSYKTVSSLDVGLPLGVKALAVKRKALPKGTPSYTGGGTARLIAPAWVVWASAPDRFEAGTPAIVNIIAFANALQLVRHFGNDAFTSPISGKLTAEEILYHDELKDYSGRELLEKLKLTLIGRDVLVPTIYGPMRFVNLDYAASTPTFEPVWKAARLAWRQPAQVHHEIISEVRTICAKTLGAPADTYDVIFTSNTTEAINLAAESLGSEPKDDTEPVVLNTLLEHSSNDLPWRMVPGYFLLRLPVDKEGFLNHNELDTLLKEYNQDGLHGKKRIRLVAVSGASNVLGVYNNLQEISRIVHQYGARVLVDAAQLIAHRKVNMQEWGIDYLAFSAHKAYAPFGSGALVVRKGLLSFNSGEQELILSSGEENIGGIAALGKSLVLIQKLGFDLIREEEQALTARALRGLAQIPGVAIYGIKDPDSPRFAQKGGVIVFSLKGMISDKLGKKLAARGGIGVRYGCHCAHLLVKYLLNVSPGLEKFQRFIVTLFPKLNLPGVVRISLGIGNSEADVDTLIRVLDNIARRKGKSGDKHFPLTHDVTPMHTREEFKKLMNDFCKAAARRVYSQ